MANTVAFQSREAQIKATIESEVKKIRAGNPIALPGQDTAITKSYIQKIENTYDVARAKEDTDNAIDLLYIAYNTTPQQEGEIRVTIEAIMDKLITTQQQSQRAMSKAMHIADDVLRSLKSALPDWLDIRESMDLDEIKSFAGGDLLQLAKDIKDKALEVQAELTAVAKIYDEIIKDTSNATKKSETALSARLQDKLKIEKEIAEADAERQRLDSLVKALKDEVDKFDTMARKYEARAETSEQRAFIMQIVKIGAQVLAAAIPPIAMAAGTGGTSLLAASALSTANQAVAGKKPGEGDTKKEPDPGKVAKLTTEVSQKKGALEKAKAKVTTLKDDVKERRNELKKEKGEPAASEDKPVTDEDEVKADDSASVKAVKGRLKTAKDNLKTEETNVETLDGQLAGLQASLNALSQGLGELADEQKEEAASLRKLQMSMLNKAEAYEKERRTQASELVKIKALLSGRRTEEETIQLAIQSLNISVSALKQTKSIIEEIAFFFHSFSEFMDMVAREAQAQEKKLVEAAAKPVLRKFYLDGLIEATDTFFITQNAEWNATNIVAEKFNKSFADGWSKLNTLSGKYITGDDLAAYLKSASNLLQKISDERAAAAKMKIVNLEQAREQLRQATV